VWVRFPPAGVAELVYAPALGADGETHGGSSPLPSTKQDQILLLLQCLGWGGLDFVFGVLISQRIAASAKEREEE
jgi:hypothetical protein